MAQQQRSIGAGIMYFVLALAFVGVAVLGVKYVTGAEHQGKLFYRKGTTTITQDGAGLVMIPLGGIGAIALGVFGVMKMRGRKEDDAPTPETTEEEEG